MADQQEVKATDEKEPEKPEQQEALAEENEVVGKTSEQPAKELRAVVLTGDDANSGIGTPIKMCGTGEFTEKIPAKREGNQKYTGGMQDNVTPVSTERQNVSRLQTLLAGRPAGHSKTLLELFRSCSSDPKEKIKEWVREMGRLFCTHYTQPTDDEPGKLMDLAHSWLQLVEGLYFMLLENILLDERKKKPDLDLTNLLEQEVFHKSLFACCLEIVIYSYKSQQTFPWVLGALNLDSYYFYRVIEVIVKVEDRLSPDMVKHLYMIEEKILDSLAWRSDGPLWGNIHKSGLPVPSCEDVCLPGQLDDTMSTVTVCDPPQLPESSVSERFQSPLLGSNLAKNLSVVKPAQSLLQTLAKTMAINIQSTGSVIIQAQPTGALKQPQPSTSQQASPNKQQVQLSPKQQQQPLQLQTVASKDKKPKRTGSLGLFFRKFYHLASVRMQELCLHLNLEDMELKRKIWTCFEHTIIHHTDLMKDRHLDQILMCSVYIICKVAQIKKDFLDIIECYRSQHPGQSHIYRSVLFSKQRQGCGSSGNGTSNTSCPVPSDSDARGDNPGDGIRSLSTLPITQPPSAPPTPTHLAGTGSSSESEDRGDLFQFYNKIYVLRVKEFALKFSGNGGQPQNLTLSPLPVKNQPVSLCRKVSDKHPVYIWSLDPKAVPSSPTQPLSYCFNRSPARVLREINNKIQTVPKRVVKRLLVNDEPDADVSPAKQQTAATKRLHDMVGERRSQTQE